MEKHYRDQAPSTRRMLELLEDIGDRGDPRDLGRVDGFDEDEAQSKSDE